VYVEKASRTLIRIRVRVRAWIRVGVGVRVRARARVRVRVGAMHLTCALGLVEHLLVLGGHVPVDLGPLRLLLLEDPSWELLLGGVVLLIHDRVGVVLVEVDLELSQLSPGLLHEGRHAHVVERRGGASAARRRCLLRPRLVAAVRAVHVGLASLLARGGLLCDAHLGRDL